MERKKLGSIESIRGMACLIVMLAHIVASDATYGIYASGCGKIGVWLFMLMSGFLSFLPYASNPDRLEKIGPGFILGYYKKKIIRIYPAYIISLLFGLGIGFLGNWKDLVRSIALMEGVGHFWYMPVILKFYLIFPLCLLLWHAVHKEKKCFCGGGLAIGVMAELISPFGSYVENSISLRWYIPVFLMGILLSIAYTSGRSQIDKNILFDIISVFSVALILVFTPLGRKIIFGIEPSGWLQNKYLLIGGLWFVFLMGIMFSKYLENIFERCHLLKWIGEISYELYFFHYMVLWKLRVVCDNTLVNGILTVLISVIMSLAVNRVITKIRLRM